MVLVVGLVFGRQVIEWWAEGAPQAAVSLPQASRAESRLTDPAVTHFLEFGDSTWSLALQSVAGSRAEAVRALRATCLKVLPESDFPPGEASPAEQELLARLAKQAAVAEEPGRWKLFELEGPYPIAAGVRLLDSGPSPPAGKQVAGKGFRVVTWAIAVPHADSEWTLYVFHSPLAHHRGESSASGAAAAGGSFPDLSEIPLPPESARLLSMRAADGGAMVAFTGSSQADRWKRFYDRWFLVQGWSAGGPWRSGGGGWHQRYTRADGDDSASVEVRFGPDGRGGMSGLLLIDPPGPTPSSSE